ncbi:MAG: AAA family ATPase [Deltaproteobacteria bacterium]|nr:AAA family ATPase [Deltaproteobacteria bacterium]
MRLVKLELLGFKSFCDRTVFHFSEGITSIVGPNGCGKSNIIDAIVWALGERGTKALRIKEMEDVIFHGSNGRKGLNIAEVTIFLVDDKNEYSIRRRLFRDGTNEYFLNGKSVRLKDIQDFFLGTGIGLNTYAIIEQGRIESFVQMKPQERKILIEEAGGITRFKEKKEDALIRLEEVRTNLERVEDIYKEVQGSYKRAEVEWERWKKYKELMEKKRIVERNILLEGYLRIKKNYQRLSEKMEKIKEEMDRKKREEQMLEERLAIKGEELSLSEKTINDMELALRTKEKDMEANIREINYRNNEINKLSIRLKEANDKLEKTVEKINLLKSELQELSREHLELSERVKKSSSDLYILNEKAVTLRKELDEIEVQLEDRRTELFGIVSELTDVNNKISEYERKKKEREEREKRLRLEKELQEKKVSSIREEISRFKARLEDTKKALLSQEQNLEKKEKELLELKTLIEDKEKNISLFRMEIKIKEDYLRRLGHLHEVKDEVHGLKRLLDVIQVSEEDGKILEKYFARELESFVIDEVDPHLIEEHAKMTGNYIFFTENGIFKKIKEGVTVQFKRAKSVKEAVEKVLEGEEGIFVVNDLIIDSRGFVFTKSSKENFDLKAEKEKRKTKQELEDLREKLRLLSTERENLNALWKRVETEKKVLQEKSGILKQQVKDTERLILVSEARLKEAEERLKKLSEFQDFPDFSNLESQVCTELYEKKESLLSRKKESESEIENLKSLIFEKRKSLDDIIESLKNKEIERERERSAISKIETEKLNKINYLKELEAITISLSSEINDCEKRILEETESLKQLEKEYESKKKEVELKEKQLGELKLYMGTLIEEKEKILNELKERRKEVERIKGKWDSLEKESLLVSEKLNQIVEVLNSTYEIDPEKSEVKELKQVSELENEKASIEEEIASLGEINFRAEKEYHEYKERLEFLERQKEDLKSAMESLKRTILKIEAVSRDVFFETLDRVNDYYKKFINKLFQGGEGYLKYNPDTDGIEMFAQPSGKKIIRMEMLSGGEKALASVALLFALIEANPPPFCFMDEVDGPLDDANLMYVLETIKDLSKKTQVIFITHNRLTMEVSGTIYGITMEEDGVSKVVSVRLASF